MKRTGRTLSLLLALALMLCCLPTAAGAGDVTHTASYPSSGISGSLITGTVIGSATGWNGDPDVGAAAAFDGDPDTYFDPPDGSGSCGIDAGRQYVLERVAVLPRNGWAFRFEGAMIQGSNDGVNWTALCRSDASADSALNYALGAQVTVSSVEPGYEDVYAGRCAADGDMGSRWSSDHTDDETVTADLGAVRPVGYIGIYWETALAEDFEVYLSSDAEDLCGTCVAKVTGNADETTVFRFPATDARYVTVHGSKRATEWGFSILELDVRYEGPSDRDTSFVFFDSFENNTGYSMFRYCNETNHGDVAEVEFYGTRLDSLKHGDVDEDGQITPKDRLILTRYLAGWKSYGDRVRSSTAADVNSDGRITAADRVILSRYLGGWETFEDCFLTPIHRLTEDIALRAEQRAAALKERIYSAPDVVPPEGAKCYYLSADGDDANDGRSPETAWKTPDALETRWLDPGSFVLFRRGDVFRGSFMANPGVTYGAYGSGEKPRLYGSPFDGAREGHWTEVAPDIWRYSEKLTDDCGGIVFDGGRQWALKCVVNYEGDIPVDNVTGEPFGGYGDLKGDLSFWHGLPPGEVHDDDGGYIYLRSETGDPAERFEEIEFLPRVHGIRVYFENVTVDNLCVMYCGAHGISAGTVEGLHIRNSVFGWIGGSLQYVENGRPVRFGNGVEIYGGCRDYVVENCHVYQCYDAGITFQFSSGGTEEILMDGVIFRNDLIEDCIYSVEYFLGSPDDDAADRQMRNIRISGCVMRRAGAGWGVQRPDKGTAAHIQSWGHFNRLTGSFVVEDNLFDRSDYMMLHVAAAGEDWLPVFRNNEYVQYEGALWGMIGKSPATMADYTRGSVSNSLFDRDTFYFAAPD